MQLRLEEPDTRSLGRACLADEATMVQPDPLTITEGLAMSTRSATTPPEEASNAGLAEHWDAIDTARPAPAGAIQPLGRVILRLR